MNQAVFTVTENRPLTDCVYRLILAGNAAAVTAPGQFVNVRGGRFAAPSRCATTASIPSP